MRDAFVAALLNAARQDPNLWLLTGDLGFGALEPFAETFPDRFLNTGVAEQNLIGVAAGLAHCGKRPVVYSIANFLTLRALEFIRNDACHPKLPVLFAAVGGGLAYGTLGYSHHGLEDIGIMSALPGMTVCVPACPIETTAFLPALLHHPGPAYLRLARNGEPPLHNPNSNLQPNRPLLIQNGNDAALLACGPILKETLDAAALLQQYCGYSVRVYSMPFPATVSTNFVHRLADTVPLLCTIEEHGPVGGLGPRIASHLTALSTPRARLVTFSLPAECLWNQTGNRSYLLDQAGLSPEKLAETLRRHIKTPNPHQQPSIP